MEHTHQQLLRQVIKRVHPDLFLAHPFEIKVNSDSLQALNAYADQLAVGARPTPAMLEFYVKTGEGSSGLALITAPLPVDGDLLPLLSAFGLVDEAGSVQGSGPFHPSASLAAWLRDSLNDAARLASEHAALSTATQDLRTAIERAYDLGHLQLSNEYPLQCNEQRRNLTALRALEANLCVLSADNPDRFQGLHIRLSSKNAGPPRGWGRSPPPECHISDEGVVHVTAGPEKEMAVALAALDAGRARLLARVANFWRRRAWDLEAPLAALLRVRSVSCYSTDMPSYQAFVLWAGSVLRCRPQFEAALGDARAFAFGVLVHAGETGPYLDPVPASAYVQVRTDCPPADLLEYLAGAGADEADAAAGGAQRRAAAEAEALEAARAALGVRSLLRLCADSRQATAAAHRLARAAPALRAALPALARVSLALDDSYRVWGSGLVSIPHDFGAAELEPTLAALLAAPRGTALGLGPARDRQRSAAAAVTRAAPANANRRTPPRLGPRLPHARPLGGGTVRCPALRNL